MKHIIIGGSGFTGSRLAQNLAESGENVLVADMVPVSSNISNAKISFQHIDIIDKASVQALPINSDDIVYHLAARQYHGTIPVKGRLQWFCDVNVTGTAHILEHMQARGCRSLIYLSTDMVYGFPTQVPVPDTHSQSPIGPYGESKKRSEALCRAARDTGMNITILRPRLIIGPGRLGILAKLFKLIELNLPVPLIGNGKNVYQMVSVFDVVQAILKARACGFPNREYNLGSASPPPVRLLLRKLIENAGSKSVLIPTPAFAVKKTLAALDALGIPLMYREQFGIADVHYLVDISATQTELGWQPAFNDETMISQAFDIYQQQKNITA